jgi:putative photosynthetic complex assembly protein 2
VSPWDGHIAQIAAAVGFALFVWWFSTGAILWLATRRGRAPVLATLATAPVAVAALIGLHRAGGDASVPGAFEAFSTAILLWGWFELSFLSGALQGPVRAPCPEGLTERERFRAAWRALAWHELGLAGALLALAALSWGAANPWGLATFAVLFVARISAKLNVFLGVPNLAAEMLPPACAHLKTYFGRRRMNWLFPVSVSALTAATALLAGHAHAAPPGSGAEAGATLVAALCALALLEHWLMVLPVRDAALWRWVMPKDARPAAPLPAPGRTN